MAFSLYLCLNVVILLSCTGASDLPDSTEGEVKDNVTHVSRVFLLPSLAHQHEHGDDRKGAPETLSDAPSSVLYDHMGDQQEELKQMQNEISKEMQHLRERTSQYIKNRETFDLQKIQDDKDLANITAEKVRLEGEVSNLRESVAKMTKDLDEEEEELKKEEEKIEEFESRKKAIEDKEKELQKLFNKRDKLQEEVVEELGKCIEIPQALRNFWGDRFKPEMRLCIKS